MRADLYSQFADDSHGSTMDYGGGDIASGRSAAAEDDQMFASAAASGGAMQLPKELSPVQAAIERRRREEISPKPGNVPADVIIDALDNSTEDAKVVARLLDARMAAQGPVGPWAVM